MNEAMIELGCWAQKFNRQRWASKARTRPNYSFKRNNNRTDYCPLNSGVRPMSQLADKLIETAKLSQQDGHSFRRPARRELAVELCRRDAAINSPSSLHSRRWGISRPTSRIIKAPGRPIWKLSGLSRETADPSVLAHSVRQPRRRISPSWDEPDRAEANSGRALICTKADGEISGFDHAKALRALALLIDSTNRSARVPSNVGKGSRLLCRGRCPASLDGVFC